MAVLNGNSFVLRVSDTSDGTKIGFAHSTDASFSFTNTLVEACLDGSDQWVDYITGKKTTQVNFSGLQDYGTITDRFNVDDLAEFLLDATRIYFSIGEGNNIEFGEGFISEITLEGSSDAVATYSGVLTMTGVLETDIEVEYECLQDTNGDDIIGTDGTCITVPIRMT